MRIGSLFSGAGGLDMAVEEVFGGAVVWQCEFNEAASKVLAHRYSDVPNFGDVTAINWDTVKPVDIMCGGYPCQPFSAAGQRKGTDDERHLWPYFAEAIRRVRPRYVVLENVAGHRSMGFDCVLGDLAAIGYDAQWCSVRASDVGAPHRRERVFILAVDANAHHPTVNGRDCERAIAAGVSELGRSAAELAAVDLLPTPNAADGNGGGRLNSPGHQSTLPGTVRELLPTPCKSDGDGGANPLSRAERMDDVETRVIRLLNTPSTADGGGGHMSRSGARSNEPLLPGQAIEMAQEWGKYEPAIRRWETVTHPAPAPTEPNTRGNPRLAAAFPEWMMGWPAGWVTDVPGISRNDMLRIIGNGVCPQQAVAALRWLLQIQAVRIAA